MKKLYQYNLNILIPIIIFNIISIITLANINSYLSANVSEVNFAVLQFRGVLIGLIAFIIVQFIDLKKIKHIYYISFWIVNGMLFILAFNIPIISNLFVNDLNGANGWFYIIPEPIGFSIQPVEIMKILMIFIVSDLCYQHGMSSNSDLELFKKICFYAGPTLIFVLLQPDFGGFALLIFPASLLFLISLKSTKLKFTILLSIIPAFFLTLFLLVTDIGNQILFKTQLINEYQLERFGSWLTPFETSLDGGRQLYTSLINIGSTGWMGHGVGVLPVSTSEVHTDFIFTAIGSFYGVSTLLLVIVLFIFLLVTILTISLKTSEIFYKNLLIGFWALLFFQVFENIGMTIGVTPITGIVLPFLSYGSTAMVTFYVLFGIIGNIQNTTLYNK